MPSNVTLVPIDVETQDLADVSANHGYRPERPTFFVWEAVTQYLTEAGVRKTFDFLATAAPGSHLVFTYVAQWPRVASVGDRTFSLRQKDLVQIVRRRHCAGERIIGIDADGSSERRDRIAAKTLSYGEIWIAKPSLPCQGFRPSRSIARVLDGWREQARTQKMILGCNVLAADMDGNVVSRTHRRSYSNPPSTRGPSLAEVTADADDVRIQDQRPSARSARFTAALAS